METTAPCFAPEAIGLSWWRRALRQGFGYAAPQAIFLGIPLWFAWQGPWPRAAAMTVVAVCLGLLYLGVSLIAHRSTRFRLVWCVALAVCAVVMATVSGAAWTIGYYAPFAIIPVAALLPWRVARVWIIVASTASLLVALGSRELLPPAMSAMALVSGLTIGHGFEQARLQRLLDGANERNAVLAVAAERERIGRDLHDILGHNLTALAVKTELAGKLLDVDAAAARAQLAEIQTLARQTLADVRATASGMRQVRLASELASARSVLEAAGLLVDAPSAVPPLSDERSEVFGWALREAVTNVVRHAGATRVVVGIDEHALSVRDDGRGMHGGEGNGLTGLRARAAAAGCDVVVESGADGTLVRVEERR